MRDGALGGGRRGCLGVAAAGVPRPLGRGKRLEVEEKAEEEGPQKGRQKKREQRETPRGAGQTWPTLTRPPTPFLLLLRLLYLRLFARHPRDADEGDEGRAGPHPSRDGLGAGAGMVRTSVVSVLSPPAAAGPRESHACVRAGVRGDTGAAGGARDRFGRFPARANPPRPHMFTYAHKEPEGPRAPATAGGPASTYESTVTRASLPVVLKHLRH